VLPPYQPTGRVPAGANIRFVRSVVTPSGAVLTYVMEFSATVTTTDLLVLRPDDRASAWKSYAPYQDKQGGVWFTVHTVTGDRLWELERTSNTSNYLPLP